MRAALVHGSFAAALAALVALLPSSARAWGQAGHQVICRIAWQQASPAARAFVKKTLAVSDADGFARLCTWADDVRYVPGYAWTKPHHYVNAKRNRPLDPSGDCPPEGCILRAIGQEARFFKEASDAKARADALKFVAHYIGDLHQPLHVSYAEDVGGNAIRVQFCPRRCWRSVDNLHAVWDAGVLKTGMPSKIPALTERVRRGLTADKQAAWKKGNVGDWARETYAVATGVAYRPVRGGKLAAGYVGDLARPVRLGPDYVAVMQPVAFEQLRKAGVRLAIVLEAMARSGMPESLMVLPALLVTPARSVSSYTVVRSNSDASGPIIGRLSVGERAELLGRERSWYRVRLADRREGYVRIKKVRIL